MAARGSMPNGHKPEHLTTMRKAADRNRTGNLQITNQVLCQLSYGGGGPPKSNEPRRDAA